MPMNANASNRILWNLPFEVFLALRYLRMRRGRRVVKITAVAAGTGIAFGLGALIVALALANGFRDEMRDKILSGTAHITLTRADGEPVANWRGLIHTLRQFPGVANAAATTYDGALLTGPEGSAYCVLRGLDPDDTVNRKALDQNIKIGSLEAVFSQDLGYVSIFPVVIGSELAVRTGLTSGERGWIIISKKGADSGTNTRTLPMQVVGVFRSGLYEYDSAWVYLSLTDAMTIDDPGKSAASVISVQVKNVEGSASVADSIRHTLGAEYDVVDWHESNKGLFNALALERRTVGIIIALILMVAALNIATSLVLVVVERRSEIALLTAMGARAHSILAIFMMEGAAIGSLGILMGVALGVLICTLGNHFHLVRLPADVYSIASIPFHPDAREIVLSAVGAFVLSILATLYPAAVAARMRPAEALRYA